MAAFPVYYSTSEHESLFVFSQQDTVPKTTFLNRSENGSFEWNPRLIAPHVHRQITHLTHPSIRSNGQLYTASGGAVWESSALLKECMPTFLP